jgi:hypothetical protein
LVDQLIREKDDRNAPRDGGASGDRPIAGLEVLGVLTTTASIGIGWEHAFER